MKTTIKSIFYFGKWCATYVVDRQTTAALEFFLRLQRIAKPLNLIMNLRLLQGAILWIISTLQGIIMALLEHLENLPNPL